MSRAKTKYEFRVIASCQSGTEDQVAAGNDMLKQLVGYLSEGWELVDAQATGSNVVYIIKKAKS